MKPKSRLLSCFTGTAFMLVAAFSAFGIPNNTEPSPVTPQAFPLLSLAFYVGPLLLIWIVYLGLRNAKTQRSLELLAKNQAEGIREPTTLHPIINHNRCLGCGSCVAACPEQNGHEVLGIINGKCHLVNPSYCIGHGVCAEVCPQRAITLVFGTKDQGVDIPVLDNNLKSNVEGIYIAGELGGQGLIKNAINQGIRAIEAISKRPDLNAAGMLDVVIVGAGPAGFAASLGAKEKGLNFITIDQGHQLGGTVAHYPKGKEVHTEPVVLPLVGKLEVSEISKEELLACWTNILRKHQLTIQFGETMKDLKRIGNGITITTDKGTYQSRTVLLALGRRGIPRKLDVAGEDQEHVYYSLSDPELFAGKRVTVVGGGDSAIEAATSIAATRGAKVALSYRKNAISRAKPKNRKRLEELCSTGKICLYFNSQVVCIEPDKVKLQIEDTEKELPSDATIICAGGILPTPLLKKAGISVETKYGTP